MKYANSNGARQSPFLFLRTKRVMWTGAPAPNARPSSKFLRKTGTRKSRTPVPIVHSAATRRRQSLGNAGPGRITPALIQTMALNDCWQRAVVHLRVAGRITNARVRSDSRRSRAKHRPIPESRTAGVSGCSATRLSAARFGPRTAGPPAGKASKA